MEFLKNKVQEIWQDQAFVSSQMDGMESWLVALENIAHSFSYFIVEHWVLAQQITVSLHNAYFQDYQVANGLADHRDLSAKFIRSSQSLSLHQTPDKGIQLPSLVLSPPSSLTPPPALLHHSSLQGQKGISKKCQGNLYSPTKQCPQCHLSLGVTKAKLELMKPFQKLWKDMGMDVAMEVFQKVLVAVKSDMFHDPLGCSNCWVQGNWEYCRHSHYHPQHNLHVCPESQVLSRWCILYYHMDYSNLT